MNINPEFGTTIRGLRKAAGFTLRELAAQVYIDFSYLSKIEKGTLPPPGQDIIARLAEVLKTDADKLFKLAGIIPHSDDEARDEANIEKTALTFGKKIRDLRNRAQLSQGELAARTGVDSSYLSKIENGSKSPPSQKVIVRLAEALKVNENDLMTRAGKISPSGYNNVLIRRLKDSMKNPAHSILKSTWSKAAIALVLVVCIASVLWFATPAQAINITLDLPASGTLGSTYTFNLQVDVPNTDLLPVTSVDLQIQNVASPATYNVTVTGLPLSSTSQTFSPTGGGRFIISAVPDANWGYGYLASRSGYGYGYQSGTGYGYGTQTNSGYGYGYGYGTYVGPTTITYTVNWVPPTTWAAGTYGVKAMVYGGPSNSYFTNSSNDTFILHSPSTGGGGGGKPGGGTTTTTTTPTNPITGTGTVDVSSVVNASGVFTQPVTVGSSDSVLQVYIAQNVVGKTKDGLPLTQITVLPMTTPPAAPSQGNIIGLAYNLGPDGATFSPAITLTFTYDPAKIPAGVDPNTLVIAFYDATAGQWVSLTNITVNPVSHVITGLTTHFTPFGVIAYNKPVVTTPAVPVTPTQTVTTTPAVPVTPTQTVTTTKPVITTSVPPITTTPASPPPPSGTNWGLIIGIIIAVVIVIALVVWFVIRRKKTAQTP